MEFLVMAKWHGVLIFSLALNAFLVSACQRDFPDTTHRAHSHESLLTHRSSSSFPPALSPAEKILADSFDNVTIDIWSSYYTHGAHLAGRNKSIAVHTAKQWTENGVPAHLAEYEVFLNYPVSAELYLTWPNGSKYDVQLTEDGLEQDETTTYPNSIPAFHGYSFTGDAEAEYVYVGLGHVDDFALLVSLGVELEGKIALCRYGGPFRGLKVKNAQEHGMIGIVMFTDPGSDGPTEAEGYAPYPYGPARQPSSIQRGSVEFLSTYVGDPTTPGYASKPGVPRTDGSAVLPKIPSLPISYRDAIPLLRALDGHGIPGSNITRSGWNGALNVTYSTGPASGAKLSMSNVMEGTITPIWNVIGIINGTEADETIILGNHRDAWIIGGAADPNSGSAVLVEVTRAFGKLLKTGWKPKRNIVICSWDAEEYGTVGSTEWVEDFAPWLSQTAISYLNVDIAVSGPLPGADGSPELHSIALDVMKKVIYPQGGNGTLYDEWNSLYADDTEGHGFGDLGAGSDYVAFLQLGIGAVDFGTGGGRTDPVYHYHSNYDSYHWMTNFGDPGFHYHVAVGQFITLFAYHLADDALIPFDLPTYSLYLTYWYTTLQTLINTFPSPSSLETQLNITSLTSAITVFQQRVADLQKYMENEGVLKDERKVKTINGKFRDFQRAFVTQGGLPDREFFKNVAYAPGLDTGYAPVTYPGITEALIAKNTTLAAVWLKRTVNAILLAADVLKVPEY